VRGASWLWADERGERGRGRDAGVAARHADPVPGLPPSLGTLSDDALAAAVADIVDALRRDYDAAHAPLAAAARAASAAAAAAAAAPAATSTPPPFAAQPTVGGPPIKLRTLVRGREEEVHVAPFRVEGRPPVPRYKAWTYRVRNELAAEVGTRIFYTDATGETIPVSDSDSDSGGGGGGRARDALLPELDGPDADRTAALVAGVAARVGAGPRVAAALAAALGVEGRDFERALAARLAAAVAATAAPRTPTSPSAFAPFSSGLADAFCRRCRAYACLLHPGPHPRPLAPPPDAPPGRWPRVDGAHCGKTCWRSGGESGEGEPWSVAEAAAAARGLAALGPDACTLATLVPTRTCANVAAWLRSEAPAAAAAAVAAASAAPAGSPGSGPSRPASAATSHPSSPRPTPTGRGRGRGGGRGGPGGGARKPAHSTVVHARKAHDDALWAPYTPCVCVGGCTKATCGCVGSKHFCDAFCACAARGPCAPACRFRFPGCECKSGCKTKACPCLAALRECDPAVCRPCGAAGAATTARTPATLAAAAAAAPPALGLPGHPLGVPCHNMRLRLRQHKRLAMGLSRVAGWGAFLLEPARRGELIGEYTGELVSHAEADRRGKAYDRDDNSYLFNLNAASVIDARAAGNKLRFANHAPAGDGANCKAAILLVDGDHRVGVYAARDLPAGAELFYDYMYEPEKAPRWAK